jgi:hypothetical protein
MTEGMLVIAVSAVGPIHSVGGVVCGLDLVGEDEILGKLELCALVPKLKTEIVFPAGGGGECDVDLTGVAQQGDNPDATNSKILEEVQKIPNLKNIYSARFEKNDDNINTYTMILPIIAGVEGDTIIL